MNGDRPLPTTGDDTGGFRLGLCSLRAAHPVGPNSERSASSLSEGKLSNGIDAQTTRAEARHRALNPTEMR